MYDEPQISSRGDWGDAAIVENNKGKLDYYCQYCPYKVRSKEKIISHIAECKKKILDKIEGIDFVVCNICNFHAQNLSIHLKKIHNIDKDNYNGKLVSEKSHNAYSVGNNHTNYVMYAKENNIDLTEYWAKVSAGVKKAILDNPKEIIRRSKLMSEINKTDNMREKASITAKKTSARPEILEQRTARLKKWRDENPEDFYNKCIKKLTCSYQSKPEKILFEFVCNINGFNFKRNQFINSLFISNKSHNKQVDMGDKKKRVYIEFDGVFHFKPIFSDDCLKLNIKKDGELDQHIMNHNWTLIRISYDQFIYKNNKIDKVKINSSYFKQECLDKLVEILNNNIPGIYKIGDAYEQNKIS